MHHISSPTFLFFMRFFRPKNSGYWRFFPLKMSRNKWIWREKPHREIRILHELLTSIPKKSRLSPWVLCILCVFVNVSTRSNFSNSDTLTKSISCEVCTKSMLEKHNKNMRYLNLINIKNNGGLVIPSADVVKTFKKCGSYFNACVTGGVLCAGLCVDSS